MIDKWFLGGIKIGWLDDAWDLKIICIRDYIPEYSDNLVDYLEIIEDPNTVARWQVVIDDPESFFEAVVSRLNFGNRYQFGQIRRIIEYDEPRF